MRLIFACIALLLLTVGAQAQFMQGVRRFPAKVAVAGKPMMLWQGASVQPDCSVIGSVTINLVKAPTHGTVSVRTTKIFSSFPPQSPASRCNTRPVTGQRVTYTAQQGYIGPDDVDFEAIFPDGRARHVHMPIVVR